MVTDFTPMIRAVEREADHLESLAQGFFSVGQAGTGSKLLQSATRLRNIAETMHNKVGDEVAAIVRQEKEQWEGVNNAVIGVMKGIK